MITAVVFDMDGVLVDSEPLHFATTNALLAEHGEGLAQDDYDTYRGMSELAFFEALRERFGLPVTAEQLARRRVLASLDAMAARPLPPMDGALPCLLGLAAEGYVLALASSSRRVQVDHVVEMLGLRRLLGATVSLDDVTHAKPAPDLFLEAARRLGHAPETCLVVEDAVLGVQAARAAGMRAVALPPPGDAGHEHGSAGALRCFTTLGELRPDVVEELAAGPAAPGTGAVGESGASEGP